MEVHEIWEQVKEKIKSEISPASFQTWIESTKAHEIDSDYFVVIADNLFMREWLDHRYKTQLERLLEEVTGERQEICFIVDADKEVSIPNISEEGRKLQVKYLLERYERDKKLIKQQLDLGKKVEEICVEMNVSTREDLLYVLSIIKDVT